MINSCGALRPVFIGGCPRSGTTWLAAEIGQRTGAIVTPESQWRDAIVSRATWGQEERRRIANHWRLKIWGLNRDEVDRCVEISESLEQAWRLLVEAYGRQFGLKSEVWIDHTPRNAGCRDDLLAMFPEASFIHVVRDPRAVYNSVRRVDWGPVAPREAGRWWLEKISAIESQNCPIKLVRYEDLISNPAKVLTQVLHDLGLPESPGGLRFQPPLYSKFQHLLVGLHAELGRAFAWRDELKQRDADGVWSVAGQVATSFGYQSPLHKNRLVALPEFKLARRIVQNRRFLRRRRNAIDAAGRS